MLSKFMVSHDSPKAKNKEAGLPKSEILTLLNLQIPPKHEGGMRALASAV